MGENGRGGQTDDCRHGHCANKQYAVMLSIVCCGTVVLACGCGVVAREHSD